MTLLACVTVAPVRSACTSYCTPVNLGTAGEYAILSMAGITSTGPTAVTGDMVTSPITGASITGFFLSGGAPAASAVKTSALVGVTGNVYMRQTTQPPPARRQPR